MEIPPFFQSPRPVRPLASPPLHLRPPPSRSPLAPLAGLSRPLSRPRLAAARQAIGRGSRAARGALSGEPAPGWDRRR